MRYAILDKVLSLGGKNGKSIFKAKDPVRESDVDNFDSLLEKGFLKEIKKSEYEKLIAIKTGQKPKKEEKVIEEPEVDNLTEEEKAIEEIKKADEFIDLMKLKKEDLLTKLKESGYIGEEPSTKEIIALEIIELKK